MAEIRMRQIVKAYGSDVVVNGVDLTVGDGEFVVLLGPSGCGKTTILRMIAGLEKITGGELWIGGQLMNTEPPDRRNVGMVFQNYALYPHMTVAGNLAFGLAARRRSRPRRAARAEERRLVEETAQLLELSHVLGHRPKELSGGQRQRVALGRAIIRKPGVFLMDEPLSNLDANLRERMRLELAQLHDTLGITTLYVTHDQGEALTLADRIVVMHEGHIRQVGTATDIYDTPADTFVAGFLGSPGMNLWTLPWRASGSAIACGGSLRLPAALLTGAAKGTQTVTIGIRPEHFRLAGPGSADHPASGALLRCRVDMTEHLGSHVLVHGSFGTGCSVAARLGPTPGLRRGDQVMLAADARHVHLFDQASGERMPAPERAGQVAVTA